MKIEVRKNVFMRTNHIQAGRPSCWFLHGFADSGLAYKEVFDSPLNDAFNLYVVDLPGHGVSPIQTDFLSMKDQARLLSGIIEEACPDQAEVNIIAHSLGALIGTWICQNLAEKVHYFFNIEGNLTEAESYFSGKPLAFPSAEAFAPAFYAEIFEKAITEEPYKRYYSSLRFAAPAGLCNWSHTSQAHVTGTNSGLEFKNLSCKKLYIWGDLDTVQEAQDFIKAHNIPHQFYPGVGHWHMVENPEQLYGDMYERLRERKH